MAVIRRLRQKKLAKVSTVRYNIIAPKNLADKLNQTSKIRQNHRLPEGHCSNYKLWRSPKELEQWCPQLFLTIAEQIWLTSLMQIWASMCTTLHRYLLQISSPKVKSQCFPRFSKPYLHLQVIATIISEHSCQQQLVFKGNRGIEKRGYCGGVSNTNMRYTWRAT